MPEKQSTKLKDACPMSIALVMYDHVYYRVSEMAAGIKVHIS
jgi:hypothetical protein